MNLFLADAIFNVIPIPNIFHLSGSNMKSWGNALMVVMLLFAWRACRPKQTQGQGQLPIGEYGLIDKAKLLMREMFPSFVINHSISWENKYNTPRITSVVGSRVNKTFPMLLSVAIWTFQTSRNYMLSWREFETFQINWVPCSASDTVFFGETFWSEKLATSNHKAIGHQRQLCEGSLLTVLLLHIYFF